MRLHILFVWFISFLKLFFVEFTRFLFVLLIFLLREHHLFCTYFFGRGTTPNFWETGLGLGLRLVYS